ncbi:hypothetical protein ACT7CW_24260 [Bacillus pacificus]
MLNYIGTVTVNGFPGVGKKEKPIFPDARIPNVLHSEPIQNGTKQILDERGADGLVKWVQDQKRVLLTDTTFRDAHQSLLATRIRTKDLHQLQSRQRECYRTYSQQKCGAVRRLMLHIVS